MAAQAFAVSCERCLEYFLNFFRLEERLAQRKAKLAEMKRSQEEELSKNDPDKQESLAKIQVGTPLEIRRNTTSLSSYISYINT
jgi:hypothetical protein